MNNYYLLIPQLLACAVVLVIALRVIWQSRRENAASKAEFERRMAELKAERQQRLAAEAALDRPTKLVVTLDLQDPDTVVDVPRVARDAERLVSGLSAYEESIGGRGLIFTEARARPGRVVLTLTPRNVAGSSERVRRVADAVNAAFGGAGSPPEVPPDFGALPADIFGAHDVATLTA